MIEGSAVRVRLLGPPTIERDGDSVPVDTRKAVAMLSRLIVDRRGHGRASLAAMFWPDSDETHSRGALRRTLYALTRALPAGSLVADRDQIRLAPGDWLWCDVDELKRAHREAIEEGADCGFVADRLRAVAELYRDDFLAGFAVKDAPDFEDWQFFQGETYRRMYAACLERLVACLQKSGAPELACEYAARWSKLDVLDEDAHATLIELLARSGKRSAALRHYEQCRGLIESELGSAPSRRMVELVEGIRSEKYTRPGVGTPSPSGQTGFATPVSRRDRHPATLLVLRLRPGHLSQATDAWLLSTLYGLVLRFGGKIERHAERHVLMVFGRTSTRENAPELAVRAAVEARAMANRLGRSAAFGISSGVIEVSHDEPGVTERVSGPALQDALKLALAAGENEILVSEATYRSTRRAARFSMVPGAGPARYALQEISQSPAKARGIEGRRGRLVGRERETEALTSMVRRVAAGEAWVATLTGDAGVGKSRLVSDVRSGAVEDGGPEPLYLEGRCLDLVVAMGYWPFIDILRQLIGWEPGGSDADRLAKIESFVGDLVEHGQEETVHHLSIMLSVDPRPDQAAEDPDRVREGVFLAVRDVFYALARRRPVVLVFEDLHWADSLSLDLITYLADATGNDSAGGHLALGIVCVYRPTKDHKCRHLALALAQKCPGRHVDIALQELSQAESLELVESLLASDDLPQDVTTTILARGQGNPFFLEEVVRALIEKRSIYRQDDQWLSRSSTIGPEVPQSVENVIRGTTDLLPSALQNTLRAASVLGRIFDPSLLGGMIAVGDLEETLNLLQDRALVYEERAIPRKEFSFRHVLARDAIYAGIPDDDRRRLHERAAAAIGSAFSDNLEPHLEQLAFHYEAAGDDRRAVRYLHEAGRKSIRAGDNETARSLVERGLRLLEEWPVGPDHVTEELDLLLTLGVPVTATTGYGSLETRDVYQRANDLVPADDCSVPAFKATYGLWRYFTLRGEVPRALELATRLSEMADALAEDTIRLEALRALGCLLVHAGRFHEAEDRLAEGLAMYRPEKHRMNAFVYGHDPAATLLGYRAINLWSLGHPEQATAAIDELRTLVESSNHRLTIAYAHTMGSLVDQLNGRPEQVRESCVHAIQLCSEGRIPMFRAMAEVLLAWADSVTGDLTRGIEGMSAGLDAWETVGGGAFRPYMKCLLADAHRRQGSHAEARRLLSHVESEVLKNGERWYEPDVYRLTGEVALATGRSDEAAESFERAFSVAQEIGSSALELRAATSRVRVEGSVPRSERALSDLRRVYSRFDEGLATHDLRMADAALKEFGVSQ